MKNISAKCWKRKTCLKSYTDRGYGEKTRVEFILNELKPDQRVTVEEK